MSWRLTAMTGSADFSQIRTFSEIVPYNADSGAEIPGAEKGHQGKDTPGVNRRIEEDHGKGNSRP